MDESERPIPAAMENRPMPEFLALLLEEPVEPTVAVAETTWSQWPRVSGAGLIRY